MAERVGVVGLQGDFDRHIAMCQGLGVDAHEVRLPKHMDGVTRLIIPGGESTTFALLMAKSGLGAEICKAADEGMPIMGTCMGMIMMAKEVVGHSQPTLGLLDIKVKRNAFGAQVHSFEADVPVEGLETPVRAVFIRAPVVEDHGPDVQAIAAIEGKIVGVQQSRRIGISFHPELTQDTRLHERFLAL